MPISRFAGPYRFLSNFYIEPDGTHVEGEYQSFKTVPPTMALRSMPPGEAKSAGRTLKLRSDWENVKLDVMSFLVFQKFADHTALAAKLLWTGRQTLIEGNNWGDTYWGVYKGRGENKLGQILMEVRTILQNAL